MKNELAFSILRALTRTEALLSHGWCGMPSVALQDEPEPFARVVEFLHPPRYGNPCSKRLLAPTPVALSQHRLLQSGKS